MSDSNSNLHTFSRNAAPKTAAPRTASSKTASPKAAAAKSAAPMRDEGAPPSDGANFRRTATRADILDGVFAACPGVSRSQARDVFEMALEEVCETLKRGESVKLRSFGHFNVREKRERIGRNPAHRRRGADQAAPRADLQGLARPARPGERARDLGRRRQRAHGRAQARALRLRCWAAGLRVKTS